MATKMAIEWLVCLFLVSSAGDAFASKAPAKRSPMPEILDQPYYPSGYHGLRIAADAQIKTFPRDRKIMLFIYPGNPRQYDVIDCNAEHVSAEDPDPLVAQYGTLALDVSRMSLELKQLGYRREIYEGPLLAYERESIASLTAPIDARATEPAEGDDDAYSPDATQRLATAMEERRARLQPSKPIIVADGGCGAGEGDFVIRLVPSNGRLWLINAFAFNVCSTRVPNPWDHQACRWTELASDEHTTASGRYMYEARWSDGTTRRGARVLAGEPFGEEAITVTFKRN